MLGVLTDHPAQRLESATTAVVRGLGRGTPWWEELTDSSRRVDAQQFREATACSTLTFGQYGNHEGTHHENVAALA